MMWSAFKLLVPLGREPKFVSSPVEKFDLLLIPSIHKSGLQVDLQLILEFVTVEPSNFSFILHLAESLGFHLLDLDVITGLYLLSVVHSAAI